MSEKFTKGPWKATGVVCEGCAEIMRGNGDIEPEEVQP